MDVLPLVVVINGTFQPQVGDPAFVEQPRELEVRGQDIVPLLGELVGEQVGVVLAVHSSDVAGDSGLQPQYLVEGVAVVERESPSGVGSVRGGELAGGIGIFSTDIEDAPASAQVDSLCCRGLVRARIDGEGHAQGRAAFLGDHPDHTAVEVTVFGGRDTRDHFHRFYVVHRHAPRACSGHSGKVGIVSHTYSVDFDGGTEGCVSGRGAA